MFVSAEVVAQITEITSVVSVVPDAPHEVTEPDHRDRLAASLVKRGWVGAPLVVVSMVDGSLVALTGSHRIAAVVMLRERGVEVGIPVVTLPELCAAFDVDLDLVLTEMEQRYASPLAAAAVAAAEVGRLLPPAVVEYLGYDVDACHL